MLSVVVGAHILRWNEVTQRRHLVSRAVPHENFLKINRIGDIALLQLSSRIHYNEHVKPICLDKSAFPPEYKCVVTGWGSTSSYCKFACCMIDCL